VIQKRRNPGCTGREMFSWRLTAESVEVVEAREALVDTETGSSPLSVSPSVGPAPIQVSEPRPTLSIPEVVELLGRHGWEEIVDDQLELGVAA